jgi:hypothetical protein
MSAGLCVSFVFAATACQQTVRCFLVCELSTCGANNARYHEAILVINSIRSFDFSQELPKTDG